MNIKKIASFIIGLLAIPFVANAVVYFSTQTGYNAAPGRVLQTNGATSTWVATSTLGITQDLSNYVIFPYASSTFPSFTYASNTFATIGDIPDISGKVDKAGDTLTGILKWTSGGGAIELNTRRLEFLTDGPVSTWMTGTGNGQVMLWKQGTGLGNFIPNTATQTLGNTSYRWGDIFSVLGNFSSTITASNFTGTSTNVNTGDESSSTIRTKLGSASSTNDGYLSSVDWVTFSSALSTTSANALYVNYEYASSTFPSFEYASSTYYLASNPSSYITLSALSDYMTFAYASSTFPTFSYASSTFAPIASSSQWITNGTAIGYPTGNVNVSGGNINLTTAGGQIFLPDNALIYQPQISFTNDNNTGFARKQSDVISFIAGGQEALTAYLVGGVGGLGVGNIVPTASKFNITNTGSATNFMTVSKGNDEDGDAFIIKRATGNVGIGTTTPATTLSIIGSTTISTLALGVVHSNAVGELYTEATTSRVYVNGTNGAGTTNNAIKRFKTQLVNAGSGITYTSSSANGDSFTITVAGVYAITYSDAGNGGGEYFGISVNSNQLTTAVHLITSAHRVGVTTTSGSGQYGHVTATLPLNVGDVVRAHYGKNVAASSDNVLTAFSITKVN